MNFRNALPIGVLLFALSSGAAAPQQRGVFDDEPDLRLPSGKRQSQEILKAQHKENLRDVDEILSLATALKAELEKNDYFVLSVESLKKLKKIEKTAKRIHGRMRR